MASQLLWLRQATHSFILHWRFPLDVSTYGAIFSIVHALFIFFQLFSFPFDKRWWPLLTLGKLERSACLYIIVDRITGTERWAATSFMTVCNLAGQTRRDEEEGRFKRDLGPASSHRNWRLGGRWSWSAGWRLVLLLQAAGKCNKTPQAPPVLPAKVNSSLNTGICQYSTSTCSENYTKREMEQNYPANQKSKSSICMPWIQLIRIHKQLLLKFDVDFGQWLLRRKLTLRVQMLVTN